MRPIVIIVSVRLTLYLMTAKLCIPTVCIKLFERKPKQIPPLSIRVSCDLKDIVFRKRNVLSSKIVSTPPWLLMRPVINFSLHGADKADIPADS